MFSFSWWAEKQKPKPEISDFARRLRDKIVNEYINLPLLTKAKLGIGPEGIRIAKEYIKDLESDSTPDLILFEEIFADIRQPYGKGRLQNSKNLRALLAEGLCESLGISLKMLAEATKERLPKLPFGTQITYEEAKVEAAVILINSGCYGMKSKPKW